MNIRKLITLFSDATSSFVKSEWALNEQIGIVLMGQSNAVGTNNAGPPTLSLRDPIQGVFIWNSTGFVQTLDWGVNDGGNQTGPELSMCRDLQLEYDRNIYLLKYAISGAPLFDDVTLQDFNVNTAELYPILRDRCLNLQSIIAAIGKTPKLIMAVIQGERDTLTNTTAGAWYNNFEAIVNKLRDDGVNLYAIVLNTLSTVQDLDTTNRAIVIQNQQQYIDYHEDTFKIDMTPYGFEADNIHFSEAAQETIGSAIASIIINDIIDGSETVAGYSAEAAAVFKNFPPLPTAYKTAMAAYIDAEQTAGNWDNIIEIQCRAMDTATNALIGWRGVNNAVVMVGGTHVPGEGWEYDGVDDWIDTRFRPGRDSPLYTQNNAAIGWYVKRNDEPTTAGTLGGLLITSTNHRISIAQSPSTTQIIARINQITSTPSTAESFFANNSEYVFRRTASNAVAMMKNGVSLFSNTTASAGIPTGTIAEGCLNTDNVLSDFFDGQIGLFIVINPTGFDWTNHNTNIQALMTALAAI
jgi:lysophospholipase L1-like esterase